MTRHLWGKPVIHTQVYRVKQMSEWEWDASGIKQPGESKFGEVAHW